MSENHYLRINVNEFMSMKPEEQNSLLCMQDDIVWGGKCLGAEKESTDSFKPCSPYIKTS